MDRQSIANNAVSTFILLSKEINKNNDTKLYNYEVQVNKTCKSLASLLERGRRIREPGWNKYTYMHVDNIDLWSNGIFIRGMYVAYNEEDNTFTEIQCKYIEFGAGFTEGIDSQIKVYDYHCFLIPGDCVRIVSSTEFEKKNVYTFHKLITENPSLHNKDFIIKNYHICGDEIFYTMENFDDNQMFHYTNLRLIPQTESSFHNPESIIGDVHHSPEEEK